MPKRKRSRKPERKVSTYRRRKRSKKRRSIPKGLFAKTTKQVFRYVDTIELDPTELSTFKYHTFSCNGMYDTDVTGTGHQPRGFDEYMQFYNHYTVIGAKLKATYQTRSSSELGNCYVAVMQTAGPTPTILDINTCLENKETRSKVSTMTPARPRVITSGVNMSKVLGQKVLQEDNNAGTATTNPAEQWYWQIMAGTNNIANVNPAAIRVLVEIEFIAVLHEQKLIGGS